MLTRNKIMTAFVVAATFTTTSAAFAAETVSSTASVTVQNAFDLSESAALNFGTITVNKATGTYVANTDASLTLSPEGGTPTLDVSADKGTITSIVNGSPATFDIANASGFTVLNITLDSTASVLKNASAPSENGTFKISALTILEAGETTPLTTGYKVTTKLDGSASFNLGAKLSMAGDKDYVDGVYSGTYSVKVSY